MPSTDLKINIGIDASRNRSGGARAHIIGIMNEVRNNLPSEINEIHVWSYVELLNLLPDEKWLIKHSPEALNKRLPYQLLWQFFKLPKEAKKNSIDIMLNTDAGTLCRFQPSVTMSRDMLSYEPGEMKRFGISFQRLRLFLLRFAQNYSLKHSSAAIFLTNYASEMIQKSSGKIAYYTIINHGVSDNFRLQGAETDFELEDEINCIYVSNVSFYKHQNHVAEAISKLRKKYKINISFIGGGEGKAQEDFIDVVNKLDPERTFIKQLDFVKHTELPDYIRESNLFIFASSCENMPNTLIEGMSSGLPIICSDRGPMPEVLQDGGLYFNPENSQSIAAAIEKMIQDKDTRLRLKKRSRQLSENYSWKRCSKETFDYLIEVHRKTTNK